MSPRLTVVVVLALVFLAGAASAAAARRLLSGVAPVDETGGWTALAREMDLSSEQERRIDSVFRAYQPRTDALLLDLAPRLQALADSMDAELLPLLTPAQREVLVGALGRQLFMLRIKTPDGERVDTIRLSP